jgi:RNA polymerase sigma-70 factor (ECF subfamily)
MAQGNNSYTDESAFRQLFDGYKKRVFGYILAITNSHHESEEITQELFIKLWTSRELLEKVDNIENYIFVMARHFAIDHLRRHTADEKKLQQLYKRLQTDHIAAEDRIIEQEYHLLLEGAVNSLSPQRKQVYQLSRGEEMNLDAIALKLGLSRNTVKNHLVEALKQIREQLAKHGLGMLLLFIVLVER